MRRKPSRSGPVFFFFCLLVNSVFLGLHLLSPDPTAPPRVLVSWQQMAAMPLWWLDYWVRPQWETAIAAQLLLFTFWLMRRAAPLGKLLCAIFALGFVAVGFQTTKRVFASYREDAFLAERGGYPQYPRWMRWRTTRLVLKSELPAAKNYTRMPVEMPTRAPRPSISATERVIECNAVQGYFLNPPSVCYRLDHGRVLAIGALGAYRPRQGYRLTFNEAGGIVDKKPETTEVAPTNWPELPLTWQGGVLERPAEGFDDEVLWRRKKNRLVWKVRNPANRRLWFTKWVIPTAKGVWLVSAATRQYPDGADRVRYIDANGRVYGYLDPKRSRIQEARLGRDGSLIVATDSTDGKLWRYRSASAPGYSVPTRLGGDFAYDTPVALAENADGKLTASVRFPKAESVPVGYWAILRDGRLETDAEIQRTRNEVAGACGDSPVRLAPITMGGDQIGYTLACGMYEGAITLRLDDGKPIYFRFQSHRREPASEPIKVGGATEMEAPVPAPATAPAGVVRTKQIPLRQVCRRCVLEVEECRAPKGALARAILKWPGRTQLIYDAYGEKALCAADQAPTKFGRAQENGGFGFLELESGGPRLVVFRAPPPGVNAEARAYRLQGTEDEAIQLRVLELSAKSKSARFRRRDAAGEEELSVRFEDLVKGVRVGAPPYEWERG